MSLFFGLDPQWQSHLLEFFIFKHCLWWTLQRWWKQCTWLHITKMPLAFNAESRLVVFAQTHYAHSPTINLMCPKRQKCHHRNHRRRGPFQSITTHKSQRGFLSFSVLHYSSVHSCHYFNVSRAFWSKNYKNCRPITRLFLSSFLSFLVPPKIK